MNHKYALKANIALYIIAILSLTQVYQLSAQKTCTTLYDYSNSTGWTIINKGGASGNINISGGKLRFYTVPGGCGSGSGGGPSETRAYKNLPFTLNDTSWIATFVFTPYTNDPSDSTAAPSTSNGMKHEIVSFSQNSLNTFRDSCSTPYTNNKFISVLFDSDSRNYIDSSGDFGLDIYAKDTSHAPCNSIKVPFYPSDFKHTFYGKLERLNTSLVRLSVYTDAPMTKEKKGSPIYLCIPSSIKDLSYIQHGVAIEAGYSRNFSGTIDSVHINNCTTHLSLQCSYILDSINHRYNLSANPTVPIPGLTFTWAPPFGLNTRVGDTVQASPSVTTTYTVTMAPALDSSIVSKCYGGNCMNLNCTITLAPVSTAVNELKNSNSYIAVYPDPTNSLVNIQLKNLPEDNYTMVLYDVMGNKVKDVFNRKHLDRNTANTQIDLTSMSAGIFYIRLTSGDFNQYIKVIKQY